MKTFLITISILIFSSITIFANQSHHLGESNLQNKGNCFELPVLIEETQPWPSNTQKKAIENNEEFSNTYKSVHALIEEISINEETEEYPEFIENFNHNN